jgi:hypothetical protein
MQLPAILDIEASGFGRGSYPIEIGFVAPDGSLFCSLIRPEPDWVHWDLSAQALHGITRELLFQHGRSVAWLAGEINRLLLGQTVYCDGWGNDYAWLGRLYDAADDQPRFRLADLRQLLSEDEAARWHDVTTCVRERQQFARHRASNDARVLQLALAQIKNGAEV